MSTDRTARHAGKASSAATDTRSARDEIPGTTAVDGLALPAGMEVATMAAGCFWGVEEILRGIPGVMDTMVGYVGGRSSDPGYRDVCRGDTDHAEAVRIVFDPRRITYEQLLDIFFRLHDPTTPNRQHNDVGSQYRSAIFVYDDAQRETAERVTARVDASGVFKRKIVTRLEPASRFWPAEEYHQDYLRKNPGGYNCHILRD